VFADVDLNTFNLDAAAAAAAITRRTRAIIAVHFAGQPADMSALMKLARKHRLTVLRTPPRPWRETSGWSAGFSDTWARSHFNRAKSAAPEKEGSSPQMMTPSPNTAGPATMRTHPRRRVVRTSHPGRQLIGSANSQGAILNSQL
jgi:hypothetical protein